MMFLEVEISTLAIADAIGQPHTEVISTTRRVMRELGRQYPPEYVQGIRTYKLTKRDAIIVAASLDAQRLNELLDRIEELERRLNNSLRKRPTLQNSYLKRLEDNYKQLPVGYFSVLAELATVLNENNYGVEDIDKDSHPDTSAGQVFANYLKKQGRETRYVFYMHDTGKAVIKARAYPESLLPEFRQFMREIWFPKHAHKFLVLREELTNDQ